MKIWLFDLAHGNLSDLEIIKGFIKYYVLYNCTIQNVQNDIHFHTNYGVIGEQTALESLNKALCSYVDYERADEVSELLNCRKSTAYKIMRQLNNELKEKGYMTISGNVNRAYLFERMGIKAESEVLENGEQENVK